MINKPEMKKVFKKQMEQRGVTLDDAKIDSSIDEANAMWIEAEPFMTSTPPEQFVVAAFFTGILFALDNCERRKCTMEIKIKSKE